MKLSLVRDCSKRSMSPKREIRDHLFKTAPLKRKQCQKVRHWLQTPNPLRNEFPFFFFWRHLTCWTALKPTYSVKFFVLPGSSQNLCETRYGEQTELETKTILKVLMVYLRLANLIFITAYLQSVTCVNDNPEYLAHIWNINFAMFYRAC